MTDYDDIKNKKEKDRKSDKRERKDFEQEMVEYLRATAINALIHQTVKCFDENIDSILKGNFNKELLKLIDSKSDIKAIETFSKEKVYKSKEILKVEIPGFKVIGGLLDLFVPSVIDVESKTTKEPKNIKVRDFMYAFLEMKKEFLDPKKQSKKEKYKKLLHITDIIAGSTDSYIVTMYKKISGLGLQLR
jgi:dGTPase